MKYVVNLNIILSVFVKNVAFILMNIINAIWNGENTF
jgi:hypothetical protein